MVLRFCLLCGRWIDITKFAKRSGRGENAIYPYCHECNQNKLKWNEVKRWEAQGKERKYKQEPVDGTYLCIRCQERKPSNQFLRAKVGRYICRDCAAEYSRKYYKEKRSKSARR